jgi:polar amino acid transport system substrate-binding protein
MNRLLAAAFAAGLLLAGCSSAAVTADPTPPPRDDVVVEEAAALLPDSIAASGTLVVGTNPGPVPFTYRAGDGQVTGADIDLMREIAERLGLVIQVEETTFDGVLDGVAGGSYDVGASGIFNTEARRAQVDFVDYLRGGTQWAVPEGSDVEPGRACGLRILAIADSVQATEDIPGRSRACTQEGEPPLQLRQVASSDEAGALLLRGEADAFVADAPVVAQLVGMSKGRLVTAGAAYDPQTYGVAVSRAAPGLREAVEIALVTMIEDGSYARIVGKWGIADGAIGLG